MEHNRPDPKNGQSNLEIDLERQHVLCGPVTFDPSCPTIEIQHPTEFHDFLSTIVHNQNTAIRIQKWTGIDKDDVKFMSWDQLHRILENRLEEKNVVEKTKEEIRQFIRECFYPEPYIRDVQQHPPAKRVPLDGVFGSQYPPIL